MITERRDATTDVIAVLAIIAVAWQLCRHWLYPGFGIPDNFPILLRPISGVFLAWFLLGHRGSAWTKLGLRRPESWLRVILGAVFLYLVLTANERWLVPQLSTWLHPVSAPGFLAYIHGNLPATLLWIGIGVVVGGVCEELLFRGFLLNRIAAALGNHGWAVAIGVLSQALVFGMLHLYAGAFACLNASLFGMAMGVFYLISGRNLWPLMIVHATWDAIAIWGIYTT